MFLFGNSIMYFLINFMNQVHLSDNQGRCYTTVQCYEYPWIRPFAHAGSWGAWSYFLPQRHAWNIDQFIHSLLVFPISRKYPLSLSKRAS